MSALADLLAIPEAPLKEVLHPDIYVEPKDRDPRDEDHRQMPFVSMMKRDCPHIMVHATPNGGRQTDWARIRGSRMGVYAGYPDTSCEWKGGEAEIEFKDGQGSPSPDQIACLNRLHRLDKHVAICRTPDGALAWLRRIGAPIPAIRG